MIIGRRLSLLWAVAPAILGVNACTKPEAASSNVATPVRAAPAEPAKTAKPEPTPDPPAARPKASAPSDSGPLNVLLILVDSLRADMPWAGYARPIAPNLTALEHESVSYTRGYSVSSYTAKSVAALLSGQYPSSLKRSGFFFTQYPQSNLFFAELLQKVGVSTLSAHGHMYMGRRNGLEQGFDDWRLVPGITFDAQTDKHVTSDKLAALVIEQLVKVPTGKPFFAYAHFMDPHDQYMRHAEAPDFGPKPRDRYDGEVFFTDLHIGKLLEYCRGQAWWNRTAVIVSADHGEAFGEHNMARHAFELWDMLTHVPLFLRLPGVSGRHLETPRSHIDVAPTVLELMQVSSDGAPFAGTSLVPELRGAAASPRPVLLDLPPDSNNPERRALIDGDYKLLVFGNDWRFDLYNLKDDPGELKNLAKTEPDKLAELKATYQAVWSKIPKVKPFGGNTLNGGGVANGPRE